MSEHTWFLINKIQFILCIIAFSFGLFTSIHEIVNDNRYSTEQMIINIIFTSWLLINILL